MDSNQYKPEQLNFWQLLQKTKIKIPIIQRDYAQGRADEEKVRISFLRTLEEALDGQPKELDFIYGSQEGDSLHPLDGQQRLTTLFLLHWYISTKEKSNDSVERLSKFSYEIRTSSNDFCTKLVNQGLSIKKSDEKISHTIKDAPWFFLAWEKDPTIRAMLIMLDAIHSKFKEKTDMWEKLTDGTNRPITFHYIKFENFGLSDDLYIKMNARGKQLTAFENFKASFEKKIEDEKWDDGKNIIETFSHKADTKWTDLFWNYADQNLEFDKSYIKFIANASINSIACKKDKYLKREEREKTIRYLSNDPENVNPENFDKDGYGYLCKCLDIYSNTDKKLLSLEFPFWQHLSKGGTLFSTITNERNTIYPQRVLFYAQTEYLLRNEVFNQETFSNWMRVVRNIAQNSTIDSAVTFIGAINLIAELSEGCDDIYDYLSKSEIKSGFASVQVKEEITKAKLIKTDSSNIKTIFQTEDTNFCKGKISFAFYCIDYEEKEDTFDALKVSKILNVIKEHLEEEDITNRFRRGLLTIGDTNFYNYWHSWLYAVESPKRCLIANIDDLQYFAYNKNKNGDKEFREYLKDLLNQLIHKNLDQLLTDFIPPDDLPNWKKRLIKENKHLNYSMKHYIAIKEDNSCCYLLPKSRVANSKEGKKKCRVVK
ncbi:DUF262 domain-containing protein [Desulfococcaceae bacterium HSG7]|nr:DUF262 domain-containing protein [Desulfococcaceae bacterium HSG7]